jgi:hypothetical protein
MNAGQLTLGVGLGTGTTDWQIWFSLPMISLRH